MKLITETGHEGRHLCILPPCDVPEVQLDESLLRGTEPDLPQVSETEISRHYSELASRTYGVNDGFYPLGSCTMKYNPKIDEEAASLPGFTDVHPLQSDDDSQGSLEVLYKAEKMLCEITGMDGMTFAPMAGAHGEFTGLLLIKAYHMSRGDAKRTKIIVPDAAHGTNPASASMAGFTVVNIPSTPDGLVDLEALRNAAGEDTAGLMLTNPNTLGRFDENICEITRVIHEAGGLNYYDGANLNAIVGLARPGDMGFDIVHLNLHKTFATPHGGGGPGSGPVGCREFLTPFLPDGRVISGDDGMYHQIKSSESIGRVGTFHGNFLVVVKALTYILTLGAEGLRQVAQNAVLNANYLRVKLSDVYPVAYDGLCMHEFVVDLSSWKKQYGVSAQDAAKAMEDYGFHPPTMYFPLIVHEALMFEPTETETKETLDEIVDILHDIADRACNDPESLRQSPRTTVIGRPDEVTAARHPVLKG